MNLISLRAIASATFLCASTLLAADDGSQIYPKIAAPEFPDNSVNLTDFGGKADGQTLNTAAFENAIAALDAKGGGELVVPSGFWLTGPIKLRSHINLHLLRGALIKFSPDFTLYPLTVMDIKGEKEVDTTSPISGMNLDSVAITGDGIIDGSGDRWRPIKEEKLGAADWRALVRSGGVVSDGGQTWWPSKEAMNGAKLVADLHKKGSLNPADYEPAHQYLRPRLVRLVGCKKVLLEGVTFENPPNWTVNPAFCEDVLIQNVTVHNYITAQNADALDLESCRHAIVLDSVFEAGDDGICLKSGRDAAGRRIGIPTEDVLVQNCTVYHAHGGFVIGSEMSGGVRNVRVDNCTFIGTDVGLRFKSTRGRGGVVEKIYISNIHMANIGTDAINFNLYYGGKSPTDKSGGAADGSDIPKASVETPQFRDIHITNLVCRGADGAITLQGLPEMPLRDITLKDVFISAYKGVSVTDAEGIKFDNVHVDKEKGDLLTQVHVKDSSLELNQ